jgi:hypothetical protein
MEFTTNRDYQKQLLASYEKIQSIKSKIELGCTDHLDKANYHLAQYNFLASLEKLSEGEGRKDIAEKAEKALNLALKHQQIYAEGNPPLSEEELASFVFEESKIYTG